MNPYRHLPKTIGVIISTYNNPDWLEKVLWGYANQSIPVFEIVIADDGSGPATKEMIEKTQKLSGLHIRHIWQADEGFQKSRILNKAIVAAESEYLIFTDQDCIPRRDFVETHLRFARKGYYLSGGYFKLPLSISQNLNQNDISNCDAFNIRWLRSQGLKMSFKCTKLWNSQGYAALMNLITPANASWNGCNSSGWKSDLVTINGFNEDMQYGGQDREFGERLDNLGLRSKQIRYSAICIHLDHKRPYKTPETMSKNKAIRKNTRHLPYHRNTQRHPQDHLRHLILKSKHTVSQTSFPRAMAIPIQMIQIRTITLNGKQNGNSLVCVGTQQRGQRRIFYALKHPIGHRSGIGVSRGSKFPTAPVHDFF